MHDPIGASSSQCDEPVWNNCMAQLWSISDDWPIKWILLENSAISGSRRLLVTTHVRLSVKMLQSFEICVAAFDRLPPLMEAWNSFCPRPTGRKVSIRCPVTMDTEELFNGTFCGCSFEWHRTCRSLYRCTMVTMVSLLLRF